MTLNSADKAYAQQATLAAAAVSAVTREWKRSSPPARIAQIIAAYQVLAAQEGAAAVAPMVAEQGLTAPPVAGVAATSLAGIASNGLPLVDLVEVMQSLGALTRFAATQVQDAGRTGASLGMAVRPRLTGYVRMLNPPSCSRCAILAGKWFGWNQGFERHPLCDCRHIPSTEDRAGDLRTDPRAYFDSLTTEEQNKIFTNAGAEAIRDGADMSQVVNARSGMGKAQLFGRTEFITASGATVRGGFGKANAQRGSRKLAARLMPESIYAMADDRDEALRLLKLYGYIL